ncbi:hypothetical protein BR93DRAFT_1531 [Coniochaeta sp. PMI_546]|nr:hypothetical protein BR93DRAFT_1531 [Coniochaeta sp. PMI_546]
MFPRDKPGGKPDHGDAVARSPVTEDRQSSSAAGEVPLDATNSVAGSSVFRGDYREHYPSSKREWEAHSPVGSSKRLRSDRHGSSEEVSTPETWKSDNLSEDNDDISQDQITASKDTRKGEKHKISRQLDPNSYKRDVDGDLDDEGTFRESHVFHTLLERSYDSDSDTCSIEVTMYWELIKFCKVELDGFPDLGLAEKIPRLLTLTEGGYSQWAAQAATCEAYTRLVWGSRGAQLLRLMLRTDLETGSCQFKSPDLSLTVSFVEEGVARLKAEGRPRDVADALEQFAWIASSFRPVYSQSSLKLSTVSIRLSPVGGYIMSLDQSYLHEQIEHSSCWASMVPSAVVAAGFPIAKRDLRAQGVEIPFDIMTSLARVSALTELEGHQMLLGPSMILFPSHLIMKDADPDAVEAVQWHCMKSGDLGNPDTGGMILRDLADDAGPKMKIADLVRYRCFLGYFQRATVHLGTEKPTHKQATALGLPRSGQRIELAREGTLALGFNIPGIVNGSIAGKVLLTRSLQIALGDTKEYEDLLTDSKRQAVVLYDVGAQTAWLVSELSVVLHVCLTFLTLPDVQRRFCGNVPELPLATAGHDGGASALKMILAHGDIPLWKKALSGESKTFHSVVNDFLRDMRTLRNASLIHQRPSSSKVLSVLSSVELGDIVMRKDLIDEKRLPSNIVPSWWGLCGEGRAYTIFGTGLGQVIRPASKVPRGWETVLQGAKLLVASMACVQDLRASARHPKQGLCSCYHLTDNLVWDPKFDKCRDCDDLAKDMIQVLRPLFPNPFRTMCSAPRGFLEECDAVIFGDHSLFHEVVKDLNTGTRRLERHLTSQ